MAPVKKKKWKCITCKKQKTNDDPGIECDLCKKFVGLECTNYTTEIYDYLVENQVEVNYICISCKETLPELRNMLEITKQQQQLKDDVAEHDTRITKCEVDQEEMEEKQSADSELIQQINTRLGDLEARMINTTTVETIAERFFKAADFPALKEVKRNQQHTQKKLEETIQIQKDEKEEDKRRGDKEKSLIAYGVTEIHEDKNEQMKEDFKTIEKLYSSKVELATNDFLQITRLGAQKENQIRPIKMTFVNMQKRTEILQNNKSLILEGVDLKECTAAFCNDQGMKHQHIFITTDKTKQQMEEDKKLREELKTKRETDPNLIIRNGKIITKPTYTSNHARWSEIIQNGS